MANKKISELPASGALTGAELIETVQGGVNKQTTTQDIADLGGAGGGHTIEDEGTPLTQRTKLNFVGAGVTVTDDSGDDASVVTIPSQVEDQIVDAETTRAPSQNAVFDALAGKVDTETFTTLTDGATVTWDLSNKQNPMGKLTSTQSFTLDMDNVKSGAIGIMKIVTNTASAITISFDAGFTHKTLNDTFTTYALPAGTAKEYFLQFVVDGTTIEWVIVDGASTSESVPFANVERVASQTLTTATYTPVQFDTEVTDNLSIWSAGDNTKLYNPLPGACVAEIYIYAQFATNNTGLRRVVIGLNGVGDGFITFNPNSATFTVVSGTVLLEMGSGDYFDFQAYQNSGGNLGVTAKCRVIFRPI